VNISCLAVLPFAAPRDGAGSISGKVWSSLRTVSGMKNPRDAVRIVIRRAIDIAERPRLVVSVRL